MSELYSFLDKHLIGMPATKDDRMYLLKYNEHKCGGFFNSIMGVDILTISPLSTTWDIGNGAGQAVHKEFKSDPENPIEKYIPLKK